MIGIDSILNQHNPREIAKRIAKNFKERRLEKNITQKALAQKSQVKLPSLKRFEQQAEISLHNLLLLAVSLDETGSFEKLFAEKKAENMDDFLEQNDEKKRKRARAKTG